LCKAILDNVNDSDVDQTNSTAQDQLRDKVHFDHLPVSQQYYYQEKCVKFIHEYMEGVISTFSRPLVVRRMNDNDAKLGDVADIKILSASGQSYGISLKHNHAAVKHQRPGALIKQLGLTINEKLVTQTYNVGIKVIEEQFFEKVKTLSTDKRLFNEVKAEDPQIILELYHSVCSHAAKTINQYGNDPAIAKSFFEFLVGKFNFDKVIVTEKSLRVMKFNDIEQPIQVTARIRNNSYIDLTFDNGFEFSMRLHTASSKFEYGKAVSLKFDTQLSNEVIPVVEF
jgi:hypothetical protein